MPSVQPPAHEAAAQVWERFPFGESEAFLVEQCQAPETQNGPAGQ